MLNMIGRMIYLWVPVLNSLYQIKWENQKWFEALNTFLFQRLDNVSTIIVYSTTINDACSYGKSTEYQTDSKKTSVSSCQYLTRLKLNLIVP